MVNLHNYSIVPPSAVFQDNWPLTGVLPQGYRGALSVAGWTLGNEGYPQQSFLGASIRSFNVNAGFGDSSSTMGIELVNDEFNQSDSTELGNGDDVYHNGVHDKFNPPVVGAPVFFKFGKNFATVEQAFRRDFDDIYDEETLNVPDNPFPMVQVPYPIETHPAGYYLVDSNPDAKTSRWIDKSVLLDPETDWRGFAHFTFGGILQSYTENRSTGGNPLYSVKLTDPREILSNAELILNNYQGTTFNNKNLYNIYGFLEHDLSDNLLEQFNEKKLAKKVITRKISDFFDEWSLEGDDMWHFPPETIIESEGVETTLNGNTFLLTESGVIWTSAFPITGQGFSRRSDNGIPWYRVEKAMNALFSYDNDLPEEYKKAGFGGVIDFRGYNYVVDWGGIPTDDIPESYYLDFDNINMLDLAQELCDVLSRELYVSLLPVIDHPSCENLYKKNKKVLSEAKAFPEGSQERHAFLGSGLVAGIIRIDTIDRSKQPRYGSVKRYLDSLELNDIFVENRDVGFEVSNVVTDKFVVGAQEVDMYYFNNLRDRDNYFERSIESQDDGTLEASRSRQRMQQLNHDKWTLDTNLKQQILPFYGFIGDKAVTIPRGFGSYQQILLDARHLDAHGVGSYYIATEMELRAATVSYEAWQNFLLTYSEIYIQELSNNQAFFSSLGLNMTEEVAGINDQLEEGSPIKEQLSILTEAGRRFGVSVPRCVWNSDKSPEKGSEFVRIDEDTGEDVEKETGGVFVGQMGDDGYPASPCSPPFGYPLYYKRAEKIGIPQAGLVKITGALQTVMTNIQNLEDMTRSDKQRLRFSKHMAEKGIRRLEALIVEKKKQQQQLGAGAPNRKVHRLLVDIKILEDRIKEIRKNLVKEREELEVLQEDRKVQLKALKENVKNSAALIKNISRYQRDSLKNAKKVYEFVKKVADDNLGKKFLVKIPRACNVNWSPDILLGGATNNQSRPWDVIRGPFGFRPHPVNAEIGFRESEQWDLDLTEFKRIAQKAERSGPTTTLLDGAIWPTKSKVHWHYLDVQAMGEAAAELASTHKDMVWYGSGYTEGALKCNFNPFDSKWEFNYKPEPQGGFYNYALSKPLGELDFKAEYFNNQPPPSVGNELARKQLLAPQLMDKLVADSNRIQCYARYDHSQHLDFAKVSSDKIEQQGIEVKEGGETIFIPDVMETLPNLDPDKREALNSIQARLEDDKDLERQKKSVAFVRCELDKEFYMAPKHVGGDAVVWAEDFTVNLAPTPYEIVYVPSGDKGCRIPKEVKRRPIPSFGVKDGGLLNADGNSVDTEEVEGLDGTTETVTTPVTAETAHRVRWDGFDREWNETYKAWIIKTKAEDLDPEHVYALITVPGRITPTVDKRYVDGPLRAVNGVSIANSLTEDVVKIDEFSKPGIKHPDEDPEVQCDNLPSGVDFTFDDLSRAVQAQKDAAKGISLSSNGDTSILAFTSPSPIYPDMVAIPLMSMERCYGPWLSSANTHDRLDNDGRVKELKFSEIGGKVEFVKEEELAPWNYAGYRLMDDAARLKTKFSNSLLLFSERGSFSYPSAPIDVSLAKALEDRGPLVTSISVNVSNNSIKTSVKLDLYTSQFGKLQKQKEKAIAQISRERQKLLDQRNSLERRGLGKGAANMNMMQDLLRKGGQGLIDAAKQSNEIFTLLEKGEEKKASMITISAVNRQDQYDNPSEGLSFKIKSEDSHGAFQSEGQVSELASNIADPLAYQNAMDQTAGAHVTDIYTGTSDSPYNPYFASRRMNNQVQVNTRTLG
tara:strand:- start:8037 stop:13319 length:5283 start_codon:yes stop_codon:yes gene_type:complete